MPNPAATIDAYVDEVRRIAAEKGVPVRRLSRDEFMSGTTLDQPAAWKSMTTWHELKGRAESGAQPTQSTPPPAPFSFTPVPDEDVSVDELIAHRKRQFARKAAHEEARRLIPINVELDGPIGILFFGDPHVDDDGTDLAALERHTAICRTTEGMFAANLGDTTNNWVGRLARLYAEQSTSAKQAWMLAEWFVRRVDWLFMVAGNHDCHDSQTEALTARGWKRYEDIRADDMVLGRTADGGASWQPIAAAISRPADGEMHSVETSAVSMMVTPSHRILHRRRRAGSWGGAEYRPAGDMARGRVSLFNSAAGPTETTVVMSDDELRLAAWILTDGCVSVRGGVIQRVEITQRASNAGSVERTLNACGVEYTRSERTRAITEVCGRALVKAPETEVCLRMRAAESRRVMRALRLDGVSVMPGWAWALTDAQFDVFLDTIVDGDGTWKRPGRTGAVYGSREFVDTLQGLCVSHGWAASVYTYRGNQYRLNINKRTEHQLDWSPETVAGSGDVWCLTVPLGNFMVRRSGRAHFSGNCWSGAGDPIKWMTAQGATLNQASEVRVELRFPNKRAVRVNARHDFAGNSQWNPAHGSMKAAQFGNHDHILVNGHRHVSGYGVIKDPEQGVISHCIQVASYKVYDRYARERGFRDQHISPCAVAVIDPDASEASTVQVFWEPEAAAEFLTWKRSRTR